MNRIFHSLLKLVTNLLTMSLEITKKKDTQICIRQNTFRKSDIANRFSRDDRNGAMQRKVDSNRITCEKKRFIGFQFNHRCFSSLGRNCRDGPRKCTRTHT